MTKAIDGLERLKVHAVTHANAALQREQPQYVAAFREALVRLQSPEEAALATAPLIEGRFVKWPLALTSLFDLELGMNKLRETIRFLERATPDQPSAGGLFAYHLDFWVFRADALLDRLETGVKRSMRLVLRAADHRDIASEVEADIARLKAVITEHRNALAHGEGGGVDGITRYWPGFLALPDLNVAMNGFNGTIMDGVWGSIDFDTRNRWLGQLRSSTAMIYAGVDALCGRIADVVEGNDAGKNGYRQPN